MGPKIMMDHKPRVSVKYDRSVDVLRIVVGKPLAYEGDGRLNGIELDYAIDKGAPCGAKVIGLRKYGWTGRLNELAKILSEHLSIDEAILTRHIAQYIKRNDMLTLADALKLGRLAEARGIGPVDRQELDHRIAAMVKAQQSEDQTLHSPPVDGSTGKRTRQGNSRYIPR